MADLCPWSSSAIPAAFRRWDDDWAGSWFKPNWYLPVNLGGYGVSLKYAPDDWVITRAQRLVAARFVHDPSLMLYRALGGKSLTARYASFLLKPFVVTGDYCRREHEIPIDLAEDSWLGRICYATRATFGSELVRNDPRVILRKPVRDYRLRPMSAEGLILYWYARAFALETVPCPPLREVRFIPRASL